jgi:hypothetical protein
MRLDALRSRPGIFWRQLNNINNRDELVQEIFKKDLKIPFLDCSFVTVTQIVKIVRINFKPRTQLSSISLDQCQADYTFLNLIGNNSNE